ncbi:MAG: HDIG domain-containing metalloprotein [Bacillota bacterium]|jgi:putative nucleotidyltransferase with HDIG domain
MLPLKQFRGKAVAGVGNLLKKRKFRRGSAAVLFFVLITLIIAVDVVPPKVDLQPGQVSPASIFAPRSVVYEDRAKTEEVRRKAAEEVDRQYSKDPRVSSAVQTEINETLGQVRAVQTDENLNEAQRVDRLQEVIPFTLSRADLQFLSRDNPQDARSLQENLAGLVQQAMEAEKGIPSGDEEAVKENLAGRVRDLDLPAAYKNLGQGLITNFIRPNMFYDQEKTRLLQNIARESVPPVQRSIQEKEKIIGEGEIVTEEHLAKLEALGLIRPGTAFSGLVGAGMLVALLMMVVLFYLYQQNREIYRNAGHLYLIGLIVAGVLAVGKAVIAINVSQWPELGALFGYAVPMAAAGMLIAILLDSRLAVLVVAVMSFMLGLMTGGETRFGVVGLISGITGIYSVSKLSQRGDLARAGFYTGLSTMAAIFTMGLITNTPWSLLIISSLFLGLLNGLLSSILTNGALPYLESTFSITSSVRLLEISHPSNPLLKQLLTEAPGTYHHSIIVGNLAETAAEAVGGEPLLVRVGAYYHDIGKIKRPYFFIENQMASDNPHDKIAPSLSTLILTSHVKDGVEMARENKLPQAVIDIIEQHHGSSVCSFFYHKAIENGRNDNLTEDEFRYEGPRPQTKEAAIVMLADSVEAAVRSLQSPNQGRIEGLVRKIIKDKLMDGQLDECDLTLKDLDTIANSFLRVLSGIYHSRIEYPDARDMERRKSSGGGLRKQFARKNNGK